MRGSYSNAYVRTCAACFRTFTRAQLRAAELTAIDTCVEDEPVLDHEPHDHERDDLHRVIEQRKCDRRLLGDAEDVDQRDEGA